MTAFDTAWALMKAPMYHGTSRKLADKIMQEGLNPNSQFNYITNHHERKLMWGDDYERNPQSQEYTDAELLEAMEKDKEMRRKGISYAYHDKMPRNKDRETIGGREWAIRQALEFANSGDVDVDDITNPAVVLEIDDFDQLGWGVKPPHYDLPPDVALTDQHISPEHIRVLDETDMQRFEDTEDRWWKLLEQEWADNE